MRRLKLALVYLALGAVLVCGAYLGYLARLTYTGYCHAEGRYLADEEKIRVAVADVLKGYPPAIASAYVGGKKPPISVSPIYYQDVSEFLRLNPSCCSVSLVHEGPESVEVGFLSRVTGAPSGFVNIHYVVRYLIAGNETQSVGAKAIVPISNCGKPVHWWDPLHSDLLFIIQYFENKDTL